MNFIRPVTFLFPGLFLQTTWFTSSTRPFLNTIRLLWKYSAVYKHFARVAIYIDTKITTANPILNSRLDTDPRNRSLLKTQIRALLSGDFDEIEKLWKSSEGVGLSVGDSREGVTRFLERNPGFSFVALKEDQIIGVVLCGHDGRRGYIHHLTIDPKYQNQGLGKLLVEHSLEQLKRYSIFKCHIFVFSDNENAIAFWKKTGWTRRNDLAVMSQFL
ncbi:MAG: GNAT family N-acetyltransferase [SAR324 cluster bacterium]|nr:GNAT family N-acetyltransferase [SAR324 cluster bacterium]